MIDEGKNPFTTNSVWSIFIVIQFIRTIIVAKTDILQTGVSFLGDSHQTCNAISHGRKFYSSHTLYS